MLLELCLLGKTKIKVEDSALAGELPRDFKKLKTKRDYYTCIVVDFKFRGIPQKTNPYQAHYVFGGKAEVNFLAYALNDDEIKKINKEFEKSDMEDALRLIEGSTTESLVKMQEEINFFLEEKSGEEKAKEKSKEESNPFLALIGHYDKNEKPKEQGKKEDEDKPIRPDNWIEKTHLRPLAASEAKKTAFDLFDIYKKSHGMVSYT